MQSDMIPNCLSLNAAGRQGPASLQALKPLLACRDRQQRVDYCLSQQAEIGQLLPVTKGCCRPEEVTGYSYKRGLPLLEEFQYLDMLRFLDFLPSQGPLPVGCPSRTVRATFAVGFLESVPWDIDLWIIEKMQQIACPVSVFVF